MQWIFFVAIFTWLYSFYHHFISESHAKTMVAYVGSEHSRKFASIFEGYGDLWAFGHRKRRGQIRFERAGTHFDFFEASDYEHMLLVNKCVHVPAMFDSAKVLEYIQNNTTVATLWPKEHAYTNKTETIDQWLRSHSQIIEQIHI